MLETSKHERLMAEKEGLEEYLEEIRQSAQKKSSELEDFGMAHTGYKANEKNYLEEGIEFLSKEKEKTINKIKELEEELSKEDEPEQKDEQIEISAHKAGKLGVTRDLASIGLSWKDIAELCQEYDELLGAGVPPAIYDKENGKVSKRGEQIRIEGRRRDVELERQLEKERIEETKRQEMESEESHREVEEQSPEADETTEQEEPSEVDSIEGEQVEPTQIEETPEDVEEINIAEVQDEIPDAEESVSVEAETTEIIDEIPEGFGNMEMEVFDE